MIQRYRLRSECPGDITWTEEGHRFAWMMKLLIKQPIAELHAFDAERRETKDMPKTADILADRYLRLMTGKPDMILQHRHFLARHLDKRRYSAF